MLTAEIDKFEVAWLMNQRLKQKENTADKLNNAMNRAGRS